MGEDQPRPGSVAVHSMFDVFDHLSGSLELPADGLEAGPRKPGHSGSPARMQPAAKSDAMTQFINLLDYIWSENVTDGAPRFPARPYAARIMPAGRASNYQ